MKNKIANLSMILGIVSILGTACKNENNMVAPVAKKVPHELTIHDHTRIDNYYWLNNREDSAVINYLNEENSYRESVMEKTAQFQADLFEEIVGRIEQTDMSVPYFVNGYYYYSRYEEGKEYPIYCRKKESLDSAEIILLDVNIMAEGHPYYQVGGLSVSPDNKLMTFGVDTVSRRIYTLYVKNLETGEILKDKIDITTGSVAWANDNKTFFYTLKDQQTLRSNIVMKHILGDDISKDKLIFKEEDETFVCAAYKTKSRDYIMIGSFATLSNEYRFLDANTPDGDFKMIQPRVKELEYGVDHYGDKFYIMTNWDAKNFRLMETPVSAPSMENWTEVIGHREDVYLDGIEIFNKFLVVSERKDGLVNLRIMPWDGSEEHYLDFGEEAYMAYISTNPEFDTEILRYGYTSMTTPSSTFDYNMVSKEKELLKQQAVLGGMFDKDNYETKRIYATAEDGTKIPVSIVYKKGMKLNGKNPFLLYAYGSYGITMDPTFSSVRLSLLDRGFIFAIAHIRGGQIYGRQWYEDGKFLKKKNTFTDYIDVAKYLIAGKYTNSEHLYGMGGSAGGLLMGAVVNMEPELFKGVIAAVPFVDVVTTMLDESIPLTTGEYDEWGNPNDKVYYDYMLSYSPYDNVAAQDYPNMLVTTGLHDSQVQYWEPAKWVAKLRDMKTDDNLLLMYCNMETGHGGASGRFERYKETAMEYAFIFMLEGIEK
ncbi:MAG: S9 family peptidase [Bacteroidales bacterium]|nr:S9 family peptidase [Bacteroidales bacterium]MCF8390862.1 S9 family peptidase [Bacteroidales bacterium]